MIIKQDFQNTIAIIIILDTLHDNFKTTIIGLLKSENKIID